jgi:signal transduction histidine kinase
MSVIEQRSTQVLDGELLEELCPYHFVVDRQLRPVRAGRVLARLLPDLTDCACLDHAFVVHRPRAADTFAAIVERGRGRLALLQARALPELTLRGQFCLLPDPAGLQPELLFFGSPAAGSLKELATLGLSLNDLPPHQSLTDYLLLAETQAGTALEARAMAERLRALNTQLELRVAERTRRLQAGNARLARYSSELEKMHEQLQHEIAERTRAEAERARMEEDLRLAHKLEAVGQLASGIAHEINTPVQFVGDNLRFLHGSIADLARLLTAQARLVELLDGADADGPAGRQATAEALVAVRQAEADADLAFLLEELPRAVAESLEGIERVGRIVLAMKEFAHPDRGVLASTDLNHCVRSTLVVTRNEYRHVADLVTDLDPNLPPVRCIPGEINQVLLNLIVNAAHAIAARVSDGAERGTITVTTRVLDDERVEIAVRDTGTGIPANVRDRIFDPFFTTKDVGQGTGQGLNMSRSIVATRHGGQLDFSTESGVGTEFTVRLLIAGPPVRDDAVG